MSETFIATSKAADAPNIAPNIYDLRFDGTSRTTMKTGKYVKDPINGDPKLRWEFTVLGDDGEPLYDQGDAISVDTITGVGFNIASKTVPAEVKMLKALLTAAEFQAFQAGNGTNEESLLGRVVQGEVYINDGGWPGVTNIIKARAKTGKPAVEEA